MPDALLRLERTADDNSALSYADRAFAGGNAVVVEQEAFWQALARIPPDGTFRVETGPRLENATELTLPFVETFATYFLLPRRHDDDARWVLCYGCDPARVGDRARVVWSNGEGISLLRLAG